MNGGTDLQWCLSLPDQYGLQRKLQANQRGSTGELAACSFMPKRAALPAHHR